MSKTPIKNNKLIYCDVDDTLFLWDMSKYINSDLEMITIEHYGYINGFVNKKNINLVKKLSKMGYSIIVWSQTGWEWAERVSIAIGLDEYISLYLDKPRYHIDDMPGSVWLGERLWRDPITGKSWNSKY